MKMEKFEDIDIWNKAIELYVDVYRMSEKAGMKNDFSAKDQLKRATLSISNNIAEGFEYDNNKEFIKFLKYTKGSSGEVRSMLHAFYRTGQITKEDHDQLMPVVTNISKNIKGFMKYLSNHQSKKSVIS
jgi:four helix bundle protein